MGNKWRWAAGAVAAAAIALSACSGKGEDRPNVDVIGGGGGSGSVSGEEPAVTLGGPFTPSTDQRLNLGIGLDLREMRAAMSPATRGDPVDWAAVAAVYERGRNQIRPDGTLRSLASIATGEVEAAFPNGAAVYGRAGFVDALIRDGLSGTGRAAGMSDNARRQFVDKGVQMLMYGKAMLHIDGARTQFASNRAQAQAAVDEAWATIAGGADDNGNFNNGLLATATSRESDFRFDGKIAARMVADLASAQSAAKSGNAAMFDSTLADVRRYLQTTFYLSSLRYGPVLEGDATRGSRETHLAEGWMFFQVIRANVAAASPQAAATVNGLYSRTPETGFTSEMSQQLFSALNQPEVLRALEIPEAFQVKIP